MGWFLDSMFNPKTIVCSVVVAAAVVGLARSLKILKTKCAEKGTCQETQKAEQ